MGDSGLESAADVIRQEVGQYFFLGLDESVRIAEALRDAGCLVSPEQVWEEGFEAGREMASRWGGAEWWTLAEEPPNPYRRAPR